MNRTLITLGLLFFVSTPVFAQSTKALDAGEIFVDIEEVKGSDVPKMVVTAVVDAPPAKVYEVVTNCDKFPERLPRVQSAKTVERRKDGHTCKVTIGLPFPLSDLTAVTDDVRKQGPDQWYRKWTLRTDVETSYHSNDGSFVLEPFNGDPERTLLVYAVHAVPKSAVPGFLRKSAQKKSLPDMIERIRAEVRKL